MQTIPDRSNPVQPHDMAVLIGSIDVIIDALPQPPIPVLPETDHGFFEG